MNSTKLNTLQLVNYRSYINASFRFDPSLTLIIGENAQGKTNLIESLQILSTGRSTRVSRVSELIHWESVFAWVGVSIQESDGETELKVLLTKGEVQGKRTAPSKWMLDGVPKRKKDVVGKLKTVAFSVEDMEILTGSPSKRRAYLDEVLIQTDREYLSSLDSYEKSLKRRNALLDLLREGRTTRASFAFWDQLLLKHGEVLFQKRRAFLEELNHLAESDGSGYQVEYLPKPITESRLREYADREVAAGHTLIGPHKDDLVIYQTIPTGRVPLGTYGSRGQQRMGVFWLKLKARDWITQTTGTQPILLLDDIFSELDEKHREQILESLAQGQIIMTTISPFDQSVLRGKACSVIELGS